MDRQHLNLRNILHRSVCSTRPLRNFTPEFGLPKQTPNEVRIGSRFLMPYEAPKLIWEQEIRRCGENIRGCAYLFRGINAAEE